MKLVKVTYNNYINPDKVVRIEDCGSFGTRIVMENGDRLLPLPAQLK